MQMMNKIWEKSLLPLPPPYVLPNLGDELYWFAGVTPKSSSAPPQHNIAQNSLVKKCSLNNQFKVNDVQ